MHVSSGRPLPNIWNGFWFGVNQFLFGRELSYQWRGVRGLGGKKRPKSIQKYLIRNKTKLIKSVLRTNTIYMNCVLS